MSAISICDECDCQAERVICDSCAQADGAGIVRAWLDAERCKPGVVLSPEVIEAFERCIEDIR